jgi:hypothetical protein
MKLNEKYKAGAVITVFETGDLRRLAAENKVDVNITWDSRGFVIERIEWLNGFDPALSDA